MYFLANWSSVVEILEVGVCCISQSLCQSLGNPQRNEILAVQIYLKLVFISTAVHRITCFSTLWMTDMFLFYFHSGYLLRLDRQFQRSKSSHSHFSGGKSLHKFRSETMLLLCSTCCDCFSSHPLQKHCLTCILSYKVGTNLQFHT